MALTLNYLDDLSRVRITGESIPESAAIVERSTDQIRWEPVRGGAPVALSAAGFVLDDYEFTPGVPNFYRATPVVDAPVDLAMSGQVVTGGSGVIAFTLDDTFAAQFIGGKFVRLTLTVDDFTRVSDLSFYLGRGGDLGNHARWEFDAGSATSAIGKDGERFTIDLKAAEIRSVAGNVTMSADGELTELTAYDIARLRVVDNGSGPLTVDLHSVELVDAQATTGYVSIVFDDGHPSVPALGKPKMDALGLTATTYIIADRVDSDPDTVTSAQLADAVASGWEIGGHAYSGAVHSASYEGVDEATATSDLTSLHGWLTTNYPDPTGRYSFAYPHGRYGDTTDGAAIESLVRQAGFKSGRTILSDVGESGHLQIAGVPEVMPYRIHATSSISELSNGQQDPTNLIATGGMIDKTASNDGGWLVLVFHRIVSGTPTATSEISQTDFDAIMDKIASTNLKVRPVREALNDHFAAITPDLQGQVWLKSVPRPFLNRPITVRALEETTRPSRTGVFEVVGRSLPVAVTDVRSSRRFALTVVTSTRADAKELDFVLASGDPMFLQVPPDVPELHLSQLHCVLDETTQVRINPHGSGTTFWTLPVIETAAPTPDVHGVTSTWESLIADFGSWQAVVAAFASWADVLDYVGSPESVIVA